MIVRNEYSIDNIGGDTRVRPKKYRLLLIPYRIAGMRKRKDERKVAKEMPCFEIGDCPLSLNTVAKSFTDATIITIVVLNIVMNCWILICE